MNGYAHGSYAGRRTLLLEAEVLFWSREGGRRITQARRMPDCERETVASPGSPYVCPSTQLYWYLPKSSTRRESVATINATSRGGYLSPLSLLPSHLSRGSVVAHDGRQPPLLHRILSPPSSLSSNSRRSPDDPRHLAHPDLGRLPPLPRRVGRSDLQAVGNMGSEQVGQVRVHASAGRVAQQGAERDEEGGRGGTRGRFGCVGLAAERDWKLRWHGGQAGRSRSTLTTSSSSPAASEIGRAHV